ncbi:hypothetical protein GSI_11286 [Ganoderma sinense ZZ0214-1]|uniref:CFEM domain-containing protein n=1 Tax=Ganoderma sinense ZZ0214-1 TaxID=1077348 RepID=A0A2G8RYN2_9APHY|nr:hypothetical protein GSI_11286 [Ganoderma sinense ZZ0214-1]
MSSGILALAQQPRWLLLSLFLVLWSWSIGLRRDGRALGLGVDAVRVDSHAVWEAKRQIGLPICAQQCALQAQEAIGCGNSLNLQCACHSPQFFPGTVDCMTANCTATDKEIGQDELLTACKAYVSSISLPTSFPTGTGTTTSISSGPPPISGSASTTTTSHSQSSSSKTATATGAPTATTTATAPPTSTSGAGSSTDSASGGVTTITSTGTLASGSSTSSTTGTTGSGNGALASASGVSWSAVVVGVAMAVAAL